MYSRRAPRRAEAGERADGPRQGRRPPCRRRHARAPRTSGVVDSKRQALVAAVMVAIVPESVEPWEPSKGRIVRCFQFFTGSRCTSGSGP